MLAEIFPVNLRASHAVKRQTATAEASNVPITVFTEQCGIDNYSYRIQLNLGRSVAQRGLR
jgi:hypothetical protein